MILENKKILFIAPSFFGYEHDIVAQLKAFGAHVDYFDERPFTSSVAKIFNRLNFKLFIKGDIENHFLKIYDMSIKNKYDFLFVISPETLEKKIIDKIKSTNNKMVSILYMWDSFRNKSNAKKVVSCFDRVFSFDPSDKISGIDIRFLALFYNNDFKLLESDKFNSTQYAVSFIGTVHSDRVKLAKKIMEQFQNRGLNTFCFYYCPSKLLFILKKIFTREFDYISFSEVSFNSMSKLEIKDVFINSNAIIDIQHPEQMGLTMRTIEMLGLNRKIITTNSDIQNYDFFNISNIAIVNRVAPIIPDGFIDSSYVQPDENIVNQYSIQSWLRTIFSEQ